MPGVKTAVSPPNPYLDALKTNWVALFLALGLLFVAILLTIL
jgi:hypothetical protein